MAIKVNVFTKKWLSQQKYRKESDNLKTLGLSLHSKKLNSPIKPRMLIPRKKHPQALDIKYMTCHEAACPIKSFKRQKFISTRGTQRHFSAQFVGRRKYCLEISKTWERLTCLRSSSTRMRNRGDLFIDGKRILGIFVGIKQGKSNYSPSSEEVCGAWLLSGCFALQC